MHTSIAALAVLLGSALAARSGHGRSAKWRSPEVKFDNGKGQSFLHLLHDGKTYAFTLAKILLGDCWKADPLPTDHSSPVCPEGFIYDSFSGLCVPWGLASGMSS